MENLLVEQILKEIDQIAYYDCSLRDQVIKIKSFDCSKFSNLASCLKILQNLNFAIEFYDNTFIEDEINFLYNLNILKDIYFHNCSFISLNFKNIYLLHNTTNKFLKPLFTIDHKLKSNISKLDYRVNNISKLEKISFVLYECEDDIVSIQILFKDLMKVKTYTKFGDKIKLRIDKNVMSLDKWYNFFKFERKDLESYNHFYDRDLLEFQEIKINFLKLYYALT